MSVAFYLTGGELTIKLPVNPTENQISSAVRTVGFTAVESGEYRFPRGNTPATFQFEAFFPGIGRVNDPMWFDWRHPLEYVAILGEWKANGERLQLVISDSEVTGWDCFIENFDRRDPTGGFGDVWYTLQLTEYRTLRLYTDAEQAALAEQTAGGQIGSGVVPGERTPLTRPESYTTKEGDTLWEVAKQFYGDGDAYWAAIWEANLQDLGADPNPPITPGTLLRLP